MKGTFDVVALLLLATATICSTWCLYESYAWGNVQQENMAAISLMEQEANRVNDNNNMLRTIDVNTFLSWVQAASENQTGRMVFLKDRFREEFRPAFDTWLASAKPGEIPPGTPFTLPEYSLRTARDLAQLKQNISLRLDLVQQANQNSDSYILTTVFGALVLFFAGIAGKWKWPILSLICLGIAMLFLVIVLYRIFTLPVILY
ncbi:MAG: hypothetical protein WCB46_02760 [Methanoregula sp.]